MYCDFFTKSSTESGLENRARVLIFRFADVGSLEVLPDAVYDADKDMTIYDGVKPQEYVTLAPGMMVIFFPQDGHAPCIIDEPEIKKAIFKVYTT